VYAACKRLFSALPLAAKIGQHTLVLHGGLFRRQPQRSAGKNKRKRTHPLLFGLEDVTLGGLEDLSRAGKGGMDPNGLGASRLASDVLWSDPVGEPGFQPNLARGVGMCFGPDVTERFLAENGLRLVLRSHEGPDAREGRDDMQPMSGGYTLDHDTPAGKLMTVFRWVRGGVAGAVGLGRVGDGCAPSLLPKCTDSVHHQESCSSVCP
jgi:serine/threonine-protein phosphatase 5